MDRQPFPITAISGVEYSSNETPDFKTLIKTVFGKQIRRIGPFIQMALIGAADSMRSASLPEATNVYLTSGSGDMDVTIDVLHRTVRDRQIPKPLSFVNTVSNAACYYLTKYFKIGGSTSFISTREFALESAFFQAMTDMTVLNVETALVGSVDILTKPDNTHRTRVGAAPKEELAQGSHWFRLAQPDSDIPTIGYLVDASIFRDADSLIEHFKPQLSTNCHIAFGNHLGDTCSAHLAAKLQAQMYKANQVSLGHYGTNCGQILRDYLARDDMPASQFLHVQQNEQDHLSVIMLAKD